MVYRVRIPVAVLRKPCKWGGVCVAVQLVGSSCVGAAGPGAGRKGGVEPVRYLLDLTNRRGPTGFSDFYLPELSGPENRATMTRFVMDCRSDRRGPVLGQTWTATD
jgi:hypothetical protein